MSALGQKPQGSRDAGSLYGMAKLKSGDTAGSNADIAAAKAINPDIANVDAGFGLPGNPDWLIDPVARSLLFVLR